MREDGSPIVRADTKWGSEEVPDFGGPPKGAITRTVEFRFQDSRV